LGLFKNDSFQRVDSSGRDRGPLVGIAGISARGVVVCVSHDGRETRRDPSEPSHVQEMRTVLEEIGPMTFLSVARS
jgi:hypothetical protein